MQVRTLTLCWTRVKLPNMMQADMDSKLGQGRGAGQKGVQVHKSATQSIQPTLTTLDCVQNHLNIFQSFVCGACIDE